MTTTVDPGLGALPAASIRGTDVLQLIMPLDELLTTVGHALGEQRHRVRLATALGEVGQ